MSVESTSPSRPTAKQWVFGFEEGSAEMRSLLGGKGANLAEMTHVLGVARVPGGFTITTEACVEYMKTDGRLPEGLEEEIAQAVTHLEQDAGQQFGAGSDPLLLSVRSGAPVSMPGMLDTVLNLGLNAESVEALSETSGNPRFAWDSFRRLVQMYSDVVRGVPAESFEDALDKARAATGSDVDADLNEDALRDLTERFLALFTEHTGEPFPQDPREQLRGAVEAVFRSWNNDRAIAYRRFEGIPDELGTAVTVQRMVFGNRGSDSGSGVAFTRDPTTGAPEPEGDFLLNAQGEDVVAGVRNTEDLADLARRMPDAHAELIDALKRLERHYHDMQDVEYTIEQGRLYILQTRNAKRPAQAAVRFAFDAVGEGLLGREEALATVEPGSLDALLHPTFDPEQTFTELTRAVPASPGGAKGAIVFTAEEGRKAQAEAGDDVILVREFTSADDVGGLPCRQGGADLTGREVLARSHRGARHGAPVRLRRIRARDRPRRRGRARRGNGASCRRHDRDRRVDRGGHRGRRASDRAKGRRGLRGGLELGGRNPAPRGEGQRRHSRGCCAGARARRGGDRPLPD